MKTKIFLLSGALFLSLGVGQASAHTTLIASTPSKGAILKTAPSNISLKFEEPLLTLKGHIINKITLTDPKNANIALGKIVVSGASVTAQILTRVTTLGKYRVTYRVAAQDGHVVTGSFLFTLQN